MSQDTAPSGEGRPPRILVVGAGGIGGTLAGTLLELPPEIRPDLVAFTVNRQVARSVAERGFVLRGVDGARQVPGRCVDDLAHAGGAFDAVFLATQPTELEHAARQALPLLAEGGVLLPIQNGLPEERLAPIAGADRVVGVIVGWGASMPEPGVFERTSSGGFTVGRLDGAADPRAERIGQLLEAIGPVHHTANLRGARWSKLAINCAISTLGTLGGDRLGPLLRHRSVRRIALEIMTEVVAVAHAEGVRLEKVSGTVDLGWLALTPDELLARGGPSLVAKHGVLLAVGARYRRMRSSMLAAIERGRPPAVDFLNGEVVDRARRHGIPTPVNARARELVHDIAAGRCTPGLALVKELRQVA